tara:strand:- start:178 stop:399 length:222 start_codon:yes stop_codon:yes gene_type:complete
VQNKILSFVRKNIHKFFFDSVLFYLFDLCLIRMNLSKTKKDLNFEIKKELKNSKFDVLTFENDFLVKTLKKAG